MMPILIIAGALVAVLSVAMAARVLRGLRRLFEITSL